MSVDPVHSKDQGAVSSEAAPFRNRQEDQGPLTLRRALLLDPHSGREAPGTLCLEYGRIKWVVSGEAEPEGEVVDLPGLIVCPGLVDLHVHLRVPGQEHKEDLVSGTRAAVAGGFTTVCAMPNTTPALDRPERIAALRERIAREARCRVLIAGAATVDNAGEELTDFQALREAGCVAVTDDAFPLQEASQMGEVLRRAHQADLPFLAHLELRHLSANGVVTAGPVAEELGLPGQNPASEAQALLHWAEAAEGQGRLHILHLTTADAVDFLRHLRAGPFFEALTAETAAAHLHADHGGRRAWGAEAKMNPPLREERDRLALIDALQRNVIQVLATDHAPHAPEEKARGLAEAPFGIVGLETCVGLVLTHLVNSGRLTLRHALAKLSTNPARILERGMSSFQEGRVEEGTDTFSPRKGVCPLCLEPGQPADLTILDLHKSWTVDPRSSSPRAAPRPLPARSSQAKSGER